LIFQVKSLICGSHTDNCKNLRDEKPMSDNKTDAGTELPEDLAELERKRQTMICPKLASQQTQAVEELDPLDELRSQRMLI
jgi:hypothetical protein